MKRMLQVSSLILFGAFATGTYQPAQAQAVCPEGRTASGQCINPGLGAAARTRAIVNSQQKFSYSSRLVPPSQYNAYPNPFDYREYFFYQQYQPGGPGPFYSCHPNC